MERRPQFFPATVSRASQCYPAVTIPGGNVATPIASTTPISVTNNDPVHSAEVWMTLEQSPVFYSSLGAGLHRFIYSFWLNGVLQGVISQNFSAEPKGLESDSRVVLTRKVATAAPGQTFTVHFTLDGQADNPGFEIYGVCLEANLFLVN